MGCLQHYVFRLVNILTQISIIPPSKINPCGFYISTAGAAQGLKLTLNVERDEYMAGPMSGSGVMVNIDSTLLMCNVKYYGILV